LLKTTCTLCCCFTTINSTTLCSKKSSHENMHLTHKNILEPMDDVVFRFYVTDFHFSLTRSVDVKGVQVSDTTTVSSKTTSSNLHLAPKDDTIQYPVLLLISVIPCSTVSHTKTFCDAKYS